MFIEIDQDDDPVLHTLVQRRLRQGAVLVLSGSKAGVDAMVSVARGLDCTDGWVWSFIDLYDTTGAVDKGQGSYVTSFW